MKRLLSVIAVAVTALAGILILAPAHGATIQQNRTFGTITRGTTSCTGPMSPSTDQGVQILGFTNNGGNLTWQIIRTSSQSAPVVVFQTIATHVSHTQPPNGNFLFQTCVIKGTAGSQDFDLILNSAPSE
jgi:hypothetical protein